jgi:5-methyltetrahydropteroyltriglutamate--homocysteine methyltransferase
VRGQGIIAHATAVIEYPETVAERIMTFARVLGRGLAIAGAGCGCACTQEASHLRQHPTLVWEAFGALVEMVRPGPDRLWW